MSSVTTSRGSPVHFPVGRAILALAIVPPLTSLVLLFIRLAIMVKPLLEVTPQQILGILLYALEASWPGYLLFLFVGIPVIYLLHRLKWTQLWKFAVAGTLCLQLLWLYFDLPNMDLYDVLVDARRMVPIFATIGAVDGVLIRLIILGGR